MPTPHIDAIQELAVALHAQGRYSAALACFRTLEETQPDDPAVLASIGTVLRDSGDLTAAESYFRRVIAAQPENAAAHFNLALTLLRAGRLAEGFADYEWRWRLEEFAPQRRQFDQPLWQGEPLHGRRILLYGEQGAGDAIQFVRYAPLVRAAGGSVILEALPHVQRLLSWMDGSYPVINALDRDTPLDLQCPLLSLPARFATTLETIPPPPRILVPDDERRRWSARIAPHPETKNVGIVWCGNARQANNAARSVPSAALAPLLNLPGIRWWSLQVGAPPVDGAIDLAPELDDFADTAAAITALDLVLTVDTGVAHLAGTLGKPTWLLLSCSADWRWLMDRDDSPWYPSMRLFRQPTPGDWPAVIERVARLLALAHS